MKVISPYALYNIVSKKIQKMSYTNRHQSLKLKHFLLYIQKKKNTFNALLEYKIEY